MRTTTTKVKKSMELIKEDEDWVQAEFPNLSSYWLHQKLVEAFRAAWEENGMKLEDYVKLGAKEVKNLFMVEGKND
jgi:hypothetical protein